MDKLISLCKRRGFIFPSSEIYGGITGIWDYGPLGVELKKNIKNEWWKSMVQLRDNVVGIDASIIMNPKVWDSSGHIQSFIDPLVECKICHQRFREDQKNEIKVHESKEHKDEKVQWTEPRKFNLLVEALLGAVEKMKIYLRGEITQGVFVNFKNIVDSTRVKIPFGVAQIGKAFRNEITPGNFIFRTREFEQMELEYFIEPDEKESTKWFEYWKDERMKWYVNLGIKPENLRFREHKPDERAHYARQATDIEYNAVFGWSELEGIHNRGDWDLSKHKLTYNNSETAKTYIPWVIETSGGIDRFMLFLLLNSYVNENNREFLKINPKLSPFKAAVFPLLANKPKLINTAKKIYKDLKRNYMIAWDDRGNIGKRYAAQDEIGTPVCITVDFTTLEDNTVTIRNRDTMKQIRVAIKDIAANIDRLLE